MDNVQQVKTNSQKKLSDFLFILWAGGAALLSYSLVYALRKPYTSLPDSMDLRHLEWIIK